MRYVLIRQSCSSLQDIPKLVSKCLTSDTHAAAGDLSAVAAAATTTVDVAAVLIDLFHRPCLCYQLQSIEQNMYVLL